MRLVTTVPQHDLRQVAAAAVAIEAAGYDGIVTLENQHDPFLPLAVAATVTSRVELATGIAIAFLRSPMSAAMLAWDLNEASNGRFVLGLGPQIKAHNERRFSVPWSAPAPRIREYVQALRAIWRAWKYGERLNYTGEHYRFTLMTPNFTPQGSGLPLPAVTVAAVGPGMLKVAGEVADGVKLHPFCTRKYLTDTVLPNLEAGLARAGRSRAQFEIAGGGFIATGATAAEVQERAEWVRYRIAFYASTPAYWPVLETHGYGDLGPRLNRMTKDGEWTKIAAEIPDELLHLCAAIGTHAEICTRIGEHFGGLVDTVSASAATGQAPALPADLIQDIRRLPARFTGFVPEVGGTTISPTEVNG